MQDEPPTVGQAALDAGRWVEARAAFEVALAAEESAEARFGLASALWWLGESHASVTECTRAYTLFRAAGDDQTAARCAVWLAITYKANFANPAAANGWIGRADRLVADLDAGPLHGWVDIARAYRMDDLDRAEIVTARALTAAHRGGDTDLELTALSQLGLILVGQGRSVDGFALIDEAMAAALAGERTSLDTVVYACCDMLNACELVSDVDRATQWCQVADDFASTYGCPFLYAECRIYYGSVLDATGRWDDAGRELATGVRITAGTCPGLHARAVTRLAALRVRQGRLEDADRLLADIGEAEAEAEAWLTRAALLLARGDGAGASRCLEERLHLIDAHRTHLAAALDLLVDAHLAAGDTEAAGSTVQRLAVVAASADDDPCADAQLVGARGRITAAVGGDGAAAERDIEAALVAWTRLGRPFEAARARFDLARLRAERHVDGAIDEARLAHQSLVELGAAAEADRVAAFLRAHGVTPRAATRRGDVLSEREREVLRLVGAGLSNPEIAARLFVSRKTASHHVSAILRKLELRNRAEAAAYAATELGPHG